MTHVTTINGYEYKWQSDNHGGGTLTCDDGMTIPCKTLHDAERILTEDYGEDEADIQWVIE